MTEDCRTIIDFLACDYELLENEPDGAKICARHEELWEAGRREGFTPLLILVSDTLAEAIELSCEDADLEARAESAAAMRADILQKAEAVDADAFLAARLAEYTEMHAGEDDVTGEFEDCEPVDCLLSIDAKNEITEIILAKIPAANPWELPAWVPMGGFNDCPSPAEQVAVFRRWHERYGAAAVLVSYDVWEMELRGKEPVKGNEEAEALAKEQFAFCYDIVMQAFGQAFCSVRGLASRLRGSS
ncbi:MAG: DUF4253 domain-containing protein, partial [Gracilibacteraceae bacterium]|nr:DUF4253 domain-containing protein [Gracilibacteraceae bacterium]